MARPRKHSSPAARQAAYRASQGASPRKPHNPSVSRSKFDRGEFIAVDGEGWDIGEVTSLCTDDITYTSREHVYALLAASDGSEIYDNAKRLSTRACLDYLCDLAERNPKAILVAFSCSYDCNHMLLFGLPRTKLLALSKGAVVFHTIEEKTYRIEYRARKSLSVQRFAGNKPTFKSAYKANGKESYTLDPEAKFILWDTFGFFQDRFVDVVEKWLGADYPWLAEMRAMKDMRSQFVASEIEAIRNYNQAECAALVEVMNKLRDALKMMGLKVSRWDGAGSIAAAMNALHKVKDAKCECPPDVFDAARHAYSGGHIEAMQCGVHNGEIYHYDVNSAYPSEFVNLCDLTKGVWITGGGDNEPPPPGFTIVLSRWNFQRDDNFFPLFYRCSDGTIIYPRQGCGWHWFSEFEVAREYVYENPPTMGEQHTLDVIQWHHFRPNTNERPFGWVADYYAKRQEYVRLAKAGNLDPSMQWIVGAEKIIKLGLNSLYGKTAQQVGGQIGKPPTYFQMEWAGYVTAGCRAKIMRAAMTNPKAVISFATDGLFATEPLKIHCPKEKTLGEWEFQQHSGMTIVMSGVYWLHENTGKVKGYSRGFDKEAMSTPAHIIQAWKEKHETIAIELTRVVGMGTACVSRIMWKMRGRWITGNRQLALRGANAKRTGIAPNARPHLRLCPTYPVANTYYETMIDTVSLSELVSAPYEIKWLSDGVREITGEDQAEAWEEIDANS